MLAPLSYRHDPLSDLTEIQPQIWYIDIGNETPSLEMHFALLNDEEQARAKRYKHEPSRQTFIATRSILRQLLAHHLKCTPQAIVFTMNRYGKPKCPNQPIEFNVSHSGQAALIALSKTAIVGVDIEYAKRDIQILDIAQRFFSSEEAQALANTNGTEQRDLFYRIWVQKEALVKWMGHTLGSTLQRSCMSTDPKVAKLIKAPPELAVLPEMAFLQLPDLYFGAVAWASDILV